MDTNKLPGCDMLNYYNNRIIYEQKTQVLLSKKI
jgi:hypothetical protein